MAQVSETTLRLDILREARERYMAARQMNHATDAERSLLGLKIAECESMLEELMTPGPAYQGESRYDENDEPKAGW